MPSPSDFCVDWYPVWATETAALYPRHASLLTRSLAGEAFGLDLSTAAEAASLPAVVIVPLPDADPAVVPLAEWAKAMTVQPVSTADHLSGK